MTKEHDRPHCLSLVIGASGCNTVNTSTDHRKPVADSDSNQLLKKQSLF